MEYGIDFCTGGTATSDGGFQTPDKGFDDNNATYYQNGNSTPCWCKYDLGAGVTKIARKYTITLSQFGSTYCPSAWIFQGSTDNTNWTTLDSQSGITWSSAYQKKEFEFSNSLGHRYFMWTFSAPNGPICIAEFEVMVALMQDPKCYLSPRKRERYLIKPISNNNLFDDLSENTLWTTASFNMTANNAPSPYVASASSEYSSSYAAWLTFDNNNTTRWSTTSGQAANCWVKLFVGDTPNYIVRSLSVKFFGGYEVINAFKFQGSNNDSDWTDLYSGNFVRDDSLQTFEFDNNVIYKYFRLLAVSVYGTTCSIYTITISGVYIITQNYLRSMRNRFDMRGISTQNILH